MDNSKAIHNIDGTEACQQYKYKREKATSADQPKPMLLCEGIAEQKVLLGSQLTEEQEKTDRKSTRLNSSHITRSRMPSSA